MFDSIQDIKFPESNLSQKKEVKPKKTQSELESISFNYKEVTEKNKEKLSDYKSIILDKKQDLIAVTKLYEETEREYNNLQRKYAKIYENLIVKKYTALWDKSGEFPKDDELTNVIFYLAGINRDDLTHIPNTEIRFNNEKGDFVFKYFNKRLNKYIRLEP